MVNISIVNNSLNKCVLLQMREKAKEIYMTFLSSKASSQVNVEGQSRLNETILETPHPLMFQKLQDQVKISSTCICLSYCLLLMDTGLITI